MKKTITIALLLMLAGHSFAQQTNPKEQFTKQDYLQKSKSERTTALILLGTGTAAFFGGMAIYSKALDKAAEKPYGTFLSFGNADPTGAIICFLGSVTAIVSIPVFISSSKHKRMGLSLSLTNEKISSIAKANLKNNYFPAVAVKLAL